MRITDVEAIWLRVPALDEPGTWGEDAFVVRVRTDSGLVGVGESDSAPAVLKAIVETPDSHASCRGLRQILIGENPLEIERLWQRMFDETSYMGRRGTAIHAISAVDIALWDIAGQHYGVPVHQLLGGKLRGEIEAYGTFVPSKEPEDNRTIAEQLLATGLRSVKIGGAPLGCDPELDREIVRSVRAAIGPGRRLAIDLVYAWKTFEHARRQALALAEFDLAWIEEPIPPDDHSGLRRLAEAIATPVSGGEALATCAEFEPFLRDTRPAIVQPDITRCGGITEMRRIHDLAARYGARLVPHGYSTGILTAATSQFLATVPGDVLIEYPCGAGALSTSLVANHIPLIDGKVAISDRPGLGVVLDEAVIDRYRVEVSFHGRERSAGGTRS